MKEEMGRRLKPYPKYRNSGVEWLGEIPVHWEVRRLKTIAFVQLSNVDKKSVEGQLTVRLCNYQDVYYNERISDELDFMTATSTPDQARRFSLRAGDVLVTKDSESWTDIAVPAVVSQDLPGVLCGYHLALVKPKPNCNGEFLARAFAAIGPRDQFQIAANGITRFGLGGDAITTGLFAMPPELEQRTISSFLDRETAKIDALIAKKEQLIELLREKRTALITRAVTKGLDPNVPMKDSGVEWLGQIPAHWEVIRLKFVAPLQGGYAYKSDAFQSEGVPVVRMNNLRRGLLDLSEAVYIPPSECIDAYSLNEGDLLLGMSGSLGETGSLGNYAIVKVEDLLCQLNQRVGRFRFSDRLGREFLLFFIAAAPFTEPLISDSTGTAQFNISPESVGEVDIGLPSTTEQARIASFLDRETAKMDALEKKVLEGIDRLKEYRTALISAAVTGRINVREGVSA